MYKNFIEYPLDVKRKNRFATGDAVETTQKTWIQRNEKALIIGGVIILAGLLFLPDVLIRKYVPFVK